MKTEVLKKHHYWIVAGLSVLLALVAYFMLEGVGSAIEARGSDIKKDEAEVAKAKPPGAGALKVLEDQKKILDDKKDELWKMNWERQEKFFTWPETPNHRFKEFDKLKFGTDIPKWVTDVEYYDDFRRAEVYQAAYEKMTDDIAPAKFTGGWQSVLGERYVANWPTLKPQVRQIWLAVEDIWVTRAMLDPIRIVNEDARRFRVLDDSLAGKSKKSYYNSTWQVDLEVVTRDNIKFITGKLHNRTPTMQLLGTDNRLKMRVKLDAENSNWFEFEVQGEFVPGKGPLKAGEKTDPSVVPIPEQPLPSGTAAEIQFGDLEQIPDAKTAAIRAIDRYTMTLVPGQFGPFSKLPLLPPEFWKEEGEAPAGALPAGTPPPVPSSASGIPSVRAGEGTGVPPGGVLPGAGSTPAMGRGVDAAITAYRKRYIEVNNQLRRIPVAIKLIVDHRYVQDVMVAYANSPLRMQLVQYHWARYRGLLDAPPGTPGSSAAPGVASSGPGPAVMSSAPVSSDSSPITGEIGREIRGGRGMEGGRGGAPPAEPGRGGPPMAGAAFSPPVIPGLQGGVLTSVSEAQANSCLVELYLFGIVTLYEKKEAAAPAPGTAPVPPAAKPEAKPETTPMPKGESDKKEAPKNESEKKDAAKSEPEKKTEPEKKDAPKSEPEKKGEPEKKDTPKKEGF